MSHILWVRPKQAVTESEQDIRSRVGIADETVLVHVRELDGWDAVEIPVGARDESGQVLPAMNIGRTELPPEGRVFLVPGEPRARL
jgi:hypothetical protein